MADIYTNLQGVAAGILVQYNQAVVGYIAVTAATGLGFPIYRKLVLCGLS